ncbi:MAG: hypothetical protein ACAI35_00140 [Candidatus Methylacidiphilales bacterium]|nr:hypothetical protein [Candidatus Methylacidiphilales bacterium]
MNTPKSLQQSSRHTLAALAKGAHRALRLLTVAALFSAAGTAASFAGPEVATPDPKQAKTEAAPPGCRLGGLLTVDISNQYITPRGLNIENQGVVFQPMLILFLNVYSNKEPGAFINDVTLLAGNWNSVHTHESGKTAGNWNENDPFVGVSTTFANDWRFDATGTLFISGTNSFETSSNVSLKMTYMDHFLPYGITLNPAVECFIETTAKATIVLNQPTSEKGFYFAFSINPTYKFKTIPLTVEMPTFFNVCDDNFYQKLDGTGGGAGVALVSTSIRLSTPLSFMPANCGNWSAYVQGQYYHLFNQGVLDGNFVAGGNSGKYEEDMAQVRGGITCKF